MAALTRALIAKQNSQMSGVILQAYKDSPKFMRVADRLCKEIMARDADDGEKLQAGVDLAIAKGVLPKKVVVEPTAAVMVSGKTADAIADEMIAKLDGAHKKGCVLAIQGKSGTGKGTTVNKLFEKLPNALTWSNGNVFRSYTLLAMTQAKERGCSLQDCLNAKDLANFGSMLEFNKFGDKFDVKIDGLGMKYMVSEVQNSVLKDSAVAKNIPTVAEKTQGEVVNFVQDALGKMAAGGVNVLVEGREQTLNYIRTPHRFELVLKDPIIIGMRQAALQMGGRAQDKLGAGDATNEEVEAALNSALEDLQ